MSVVLHFYHGVSDMPWHEMGAVFFLHSLFWSVNQKQLKSQKYPDHLRQIRKRMDK